MMEEWELEAQAIEEEIAGQGPELETVTIPGTECQVCHIRETRAVTIPKDAWRVFMSCHNGWAIRSTICDHCSSLDMLGGTYFANKQHGVPGPKFRRQ